MNVCPPDTTNETNGGFKSLCWIKLAQIWPCIWFTGINGLFEPNANPFAYWSPTSNAPTKPGPYVTPIASISSNLSPASSSAALTTLSTTSICILDATSGTTPPYFLCVSIWDAITLDKTSLPLTTTAADVSSQLDSIDKIIFLSIFIPLLISLCYIKYQITIINCIL